MKLAELEPRWVAASDAPNDAKQGVSFWCPCCVSKSQRTRLAVFFDVPICGRPPVDLAQLHQERVRADDHPLKDVHVGSVLWHREGDSFDNLTLTPSIDASQFGHWHGYITNGDVR